MIMPLPLLKVTVFFVSLCFNMVSFKGQKKPGPCLDWSPLGKLLTSIPLLFIWEFPLSPPPHPPPPPTILGLPLGTKLKGSLQRCATLMRNTDYMSQFMHSMQHGSNFYLGEIVSFTLPQKDIWRLVFINLVSFKVSCCFISTEIKMSCIDQATVPHVFLVVFVMKEADFLLMILNSRENCCLNLFQILC